MKKRTLAEKEEARTRRDRLMHAATRAQLSLTDGVREMRAISGLTQDQFAEHRGISTRVIKALELGKANPTVATLNRIADFYGLEVGFVPIKHQQPAEIGITTELEERSNPIARIKEAMDQQNRALSDLLNNAELLAMLTKASSASESSTEQTAQSDRMLNQRGNMKAAKKRSAI